jgi:hypothetical protein
MVADLKPGTPEEYRRIPRIWKSPSPPASGTTRQLKALLAVSLPKTDERCVTGRRSW